MIAVGFIVVAYLALIAEYGWLGLSAMVIHVALMCLALHR